MQNSNTARRLFMLGLDAADIELIRQWGNEGLLPNFQCLLETGLWGEMQTITELSHTAVWPSIITGTNPGQHGIYNIYQAEAGGYDIYRVKAEQCRRPAFWKCLDDQGKKCIIFDAPFDYLIKDFKGIQIAEWGSWVRYTDQTGQPGHIWRGLKNRVGLPPLENEATVKPFAEDEKSRLLSWLKEGIRLKTKAIQWLVKTQPWALFLAVFPEIHPASHFFWSLKKPDADPDCLNIAPESNLKEIYQSIDQAIGQLADGLDETDVLMILSGDRLRPSFSAWHLLPQISSRLGFMFPKSDEFGTASGGGVSNRNDFLMRLRNLIPERSRKLISRALPASVKFKMWQSWNRSNLDWARTKFFCVPNDCQGHIRINVKGREVSGVVNPGSEFDALCMEIEEKFSGLIDPQNGRKCVKQVLRADRHFTGNCAAQLPDIIIMWDDNAGVCNEMLLNGIGPIQNQTAVYELPPYYIANHKGPGFVLVNGKSIRSGKLNGDPHIYDLAPSILSFFGLALSNSFDGVDRNLFHNVDSA